MPAKMSARRSSVFCGLRCWSCPADSLSDPAVAGSSSVPARLLSPSSEDCPFQAGDVNNSGNLTSGDIIYLVNFVFKGGPPPVIP